MPTTELIGTAEIELPKALRGLVPAGILAGYPIAVLSAMKRLKYGFPYTMWDARRPTPQDKMPRKPQSIQYPPGMEPKGKVIEARRFEKYYAHEKYTQSASDGPINGTSGTWHFDPKPTLWM